MLFTRGIHGALLCVLLILGSSCSRSKTTRPSTVREALAKREYGALVGYVKKGKEFSKDVYLELGRRMASQDRDERLVVMAILARLPNRGQYRCVITGWDTDIAYDKVRVLYNLGILGDVAAVPFVLEKAKEGSYGERRAAVCALRMILDRAKGLNVGNMPLDAAGYLLERTSGPSDPRVRWMEMEKPLQEFRKWWERDGAGLLTKRNLREDYWQ